MTKRRAMNFLKPDPKALSAFYTVQGLFRYPNRGTKKPLHWVMNINRLPILIMLFTLYSPAFLRSSTTSLSHKSRLGLERVGVVPFIIISACCCCCFCCCLRCVSLLSTSEISSKPKFAFFEIKWSGRSVCIKCENGRVVVDGNFLPTMLTCLQLR